MGERRLDLYDLRGRLGFGAGRPSAVTLISSQSQSASSHMSADICRQGFAPG